MDFPKEELPAYRLRMARGFRILRRVCGKQSRTPTVCYHPDNPGNLGFGGGRCIRDRCPVWRQLQEANATNQEES